MTALRIKVKRGKLGRWRWFLYNEAGKHAGSLRVWGYRTKAQCEIAAQHLFGAAVMLETKDGEMYAGSRYFDHL